MIAELKIGYQTYTFQTDPDLGDLDGECDVEKAVIRLNPDQAGWRLVNTTIHEVLRAIWDQWVDPQVDAETEERIVAGIANGLTSILADNPDITVMRLTRGQVDSPPG